MSAARARRDAIALLKLAARPLAVEWRGDTAALSAPDGRGRRVPSVMVRALVSSGALASGAGGIVRTPAGTARLRRLLAAGTEAAGTEAAGGSGAAAGDAHTGQQRDVGPGTVLQPDGTREDVTVNHAESALARLARRRVDGAPFLHPELLEAGRRLQSDFERAGLRQRVTARWDAVGGGSRRGDGGGRAEIADSAIAARDRWNRAVSALGDELGPATVDLVCFDKGLTDIERERGWPKRSAKMMLRAGLEQLALHYRAPRTR